MPVDSAAEGNVNTEIIVVVFVILCATFFFSGKCQYLLRLMVSDHCLALHSAPCDSCNYEWII